MGMLKKIVLFMLLLPVVSYCAQEGISFLDEAEDIQPGGIIILITLEGNRYPLPFDFAMRSEFIRVAWQVNKHKSEIPINITDEDMYTLIEALKKLNDRFASKKLSLEYFRDMLDFEDYLFDKKRILSDYPQQEMKSLDEEEIKSLDEAEDIQPGRIITLVSIESNRYLVPFEVVMQSEFIKTALEGDKEVNEIKLPIKDEYLQPLVQALAIITNNKDKFSAKRLYGIIQDNLSFTQYSLEQLSQLFIEAIKLGNYFLQNAIADFFAKIINQGNMNHFVPLIKPDHWYLIEKYYYLRSKELRVQPNNLLFKRNNQLSENLFKLYFKNSHQKFNLESIGNKIIYNMNLSVQDLLDYGKYSKKMSRYENFIDLFGFNLRSLDGLSNIEDTQYVMNLSLAHNLITKFPGNTFSGLNKLRKLNLSNNLITELPYNIFSDLSELKQLGIFNNLITELPENIFTGLNKLEWLNLSNNQITELQDNIFSDLSELKQLYLQNNHITPASIEMLEQFAQSHPNIRIKY